MSSLVASHYPKQIERFRAIFANLERHGGKRVVSVTTMTNETGFERRAIATDLRYLVELGVIHRVLGSSTFGVGQDPSTLRLVMTWEEFLEQAGALRDEWRKTRAAKRAAATGLVASLNGGKMTMNPARAKALEIRNSLPAAPTAIPVDDPLIDAELEQMDDEYLLTWG